MPESMEIPPHIDLRELTEYEVEDRLTPDELALHNELAIELNEPDVLGDDPKWEHYYFLHSKALGQDLDKAA
ncbi:MAG: hypothetical protein V4465_01185 [Patescibacteria group bacterium]